MDKYIKRYVGMRAILKSNTKFSFGGNVHHLSMLLMTIIIFNELYRYIFFS